MMNDLGWDEEETSMANAVLGNSASDFLKTISSSNQSLFLLMETDDTLSKKLSSLVEWPNSENFSWNYAILWQQTVSRSGHRVLGWGDGCCREPKEEESSVCNCRSSTLEEEEMRKRVLQKLQRVFGSLSQTCLHSIFQHLFFSEHHRKRIQLRSFSRSYDYNIL
ncbi:hypothetical protein F2Q68_00028471 [Brassica cretica]|uniref:Transcription factor n=1 Tax=Brassica cretica TaxID=69181 RepID=A0A8S9IKG7_BRACR|nr:hypothetical protein F2Q68_00028471 [Brassica cretica]